MATYNGHNEDSSGNILLAIGNGMTATLETGTTASQAYTKGALLYYNNRLCKATKAIAKSATLTIGTNIAYTTIGEELTAHLRASNGDELYFDYKDSKPGYYPSASKTASQFVPFGGSTLPDTPTASNKKNITNGATDNRAFICKLTSVYTKIYGDHKISGACAINLYFYDSNGEYISYLDTILNLPNIMSNSANITVPSDTAYATIGVRGTTTTNVDVWFS